MRTSKHVPAGRSRRTLYTAMVGLLATISVVATTQTVSLQDIAEMTGTETATSNRWLARLINIPKGSDHAKVAYRLSADSQKIVRYAMGVKTVEAVTSLDPNHSLVAKGDFYINRAMKGDRVFTPPKEMKVARAPTHLMNTDTIVTSSVVAAADGADGAVSTVKYAPNKRLLAMAGSFQPLQQVAKTPAAPAGVGGRKFALSITQMKQVRSAARQMASVMVKVRKAQTLAQASAQSGKVVEAPSVASAYAPQEKSMASAFAAVLAPAMPKSIIRLARGDHKWAANPLPRSAFSKKARQCLATGIYFEARSEPVTGQQAVAQVILNRVKNPTYPNSVCGVVFQNKWKRNACQFSFACDGIRDRVKSRKHWNKAVDIANNAIDGRVWLTSVGSASHYHADYVWPKWRRKMRKMTKIGRHIFYRTFGGGWS